jgi:ribosome maturation factor RimP
LQISRHIENELDREIEDFQLSVSSPGLSKAFLVEQQYQKNIGKEIVVKLRQGKKIKGKLIAFDGNIVLEINKKEKGKKQIKKEEKVILLEEIKETKLVIKF